MTEKRFELSKSDIKDFRIYDYEKEDAYFIGCDKHTGDCLVSLLNELHEENQIKLEIIDSFIRGLEDEKGIDPENVEFQCRMNFTIKVLKKLKKDMLDTTEFKRLKELIE